MQGLKKVELAEVNKGAAEELFNREMERVLENIEDPSTAPAEKREITLKFIITPNKQREMGELEIKASSKLAPAKSTNSTMVFQDGGIFEPDYVQQQFNFDNVTKMDSKSLAAGEREED